MGRPGGGSIFRVEIPVERSNTGVAVERIAPRRIAGIRAGTNVPKILVVDDHLVNRDWLMKLLISVGFSVRGADNGEAAIRQWEEWNPALILMDIHMPGMDGLEATRRIKAASSRKQTAIVALTASAMDEERQIISQSGADDFLAKPCREDDIFEMLRIHLNVTYDYEETSESKDVATLTDERLKQLPRELVEEILEATSNGKKKLLDALILKVGETNDAESALVLQQLTDRYEYDTLARLLESALDR